MTDTLDKILNGTFLIEDYSLMEKNNINKRISELTNANKILMQNNDILIKENVILNEDIKKREILTRELLKKTNELNNSMIDINKTSSELLDINNEQKHDILKLTDENKKLLDENLKLKNCIKDIELNYKHLYYTNKKLVTDNDQLTNSKQILYENNEKLKLEMEWLVKYTSGLNIELKNNENVSENNLLLFDINEKLYTEIQNKNLIHEKLLETNRKLEKDIKKYQKETQSVKNIIPKKF